jgi:hypothetical protein
MTAARRSSRARVAALLAVLAAAPLLARFYARNERLGAMPETIAAAVTAHALVRAGTLDVSSYYPGAHVAGGRPYAVRARDGGLYNIYPLASSLTFAPLFLPWRDLPAEGFRLRWRLFHFIAAGLTAFAVVLLAAWLLTVVPVPRAIAVTAVIALATSVRSVSATGLWQHTSAAPWAIAGLGLWTAAARRPALHPAAGVCLAMATACRPIFLPAALLVVWSAIRAGGARGPAPLTAALVAVVGGGALAGNWWVHGTLIGGQSTMIQTISSSHAVGAYFDFSVGNLLGLLAAPSRGLFVYSPVLLFAVPGGVRTLRGDRPIERLITVAGLSMFVLYGFIATWWAGWGYGPRYMTDLMPFFALWLARAPLPRRPIATVVLAAALAWSIAAYELGVRAYPCGWDASPVSIDRAPGRLWRLRDTEIARCWAALRRRR